MQWRLVAAATSDVIPAQTQRPSQRRSFFMAQFDIFQAAFDNTAFRRVLFTSENCQVAVMSIAPNESLESALTATDKYIIVLHGSGKAAIAGKEMEIKIGNFISILAGDAHALENTGREDLKLIVIYCPPQFSAEAIHGRRLDAVLDPDSSPDEE